MLNDTYQKIAGTKVHRVPDPTGDWDRVWKNKNRLLTGLYEYTTGGKTGYTKRAKRTLVTTASKDNLELIAVTLNGPDDWDDHINMYEYGFRNYELVTVLKEGIIKKVDDEFYKKKVYLIKMFCILLPIKNVNYSISKSLYKSQKRNGEIKSLNQISLERPS